MKKINYTLAELAALLGAELCGDPECLISGVATLQKATAGQISFLDNVRYRKYLPEAKASAVILSAANKSSCATNALIMSNPYLGYAKVAGLFACTPENKAGIHASAVIGERCQIHPTACIGPLCVIGNDVVIGENAVIGAGCLIGERSQVGAGSYFWPKVTLYFDTQVGQRVIIHSGAVLGSDGFGFALDQGIWHKVAQLGRVIVGNDVEIGANAAIDRGAIEDTILEDGVKVDNLVQIAHNVVIGAHTAIAGCVGIAGSTKIGRHCAIGGGVGIAGHISIVDGVIITGGALVAQSITEPGIYTSGTSVQPTLQWKKNLARIYKLDEMAKRVKELEKKLEKITNEEELI